MAGTVAVSTAAAWIEAGVATMMIAATPSSTAEIAAKSLTAAVSILSTVKAAAVSMIVVNSCCVADSWAINHYVDGCGLFVNSEGCCSSTAGIPFADSYCIDG